MNIIKIDINHDNVLAFDGPDPVTGIFSIYLKEEKIPVGLVATYQSRTVRDPGETPESAIKGFTDSDFINDRGILRNVVDGLNAIKK